MPVPAKVVQGRRPPAICAWHQWETTTDGKCQIVRPGWTDSMRAGPAVSARGWPGRGASCRAGGGPALDVAASAHHDRDVEVFLAASDLEGDSISRALLSQ